MRTTHWTSLTRAFAAMFLATSIALGATMQPASADQAAAARNTILGAALLVAGIATAVNVSNKNAQANAVTGYPPDGSGYNGNRYGNHNGYRYNGYNGNDGRYAYGRR